jgi:hypothetical protein
MEPYQATRHGLEEEEEEGLTHLPGRPRPGDQAELDQILLQSQVESINSQLLQRIRSQRPANTKKQYQPKQKEWAV